jgi:cell division protein FtsB
MKDFQERNKGGFRRFLGSKLVLGFLMLLVIGMTIASFRVLERGKEAKKAEEALKAEVAALQQRKEDLTREQKDLASGSGIEREAREKLNFRKPGEQVVIIVPDKSPTPNPEPPKSMKDKLWEKFMSLFGK